MLSEIIKRNRSYRRFAQNESIPIEVLVGFIENARLTPSARNMQPLKYCIVNSPEGCEAIFPNTAWAGYIKDGAPTEGERPAAYIIICNDTSLSPSSQWDEGIVSQTITLSAAEKGLGCCIIVSIKKKEIAAYLDLPDNLVPTIAIAIGRPVEEVVVTEPVDGDIKYCRDENRVHYVPKRPMAEIVVKKI